MSRSDLWLTILVAVNTYAVSFAVSFAVLQHIKLVDPIKPVATVERVETAGKMRVVHLFPDTPEVYTRLQILEEKQAEAENSILLLMKNQEKVVDLLDQVINQVVGK